MNKYLNNLEKKINNLEKKIDVIRKSINNLNSLVWDLEELRDELRDELFECTPSDDPHYDNPDYASEIHGNFGRSDY